VPRAAEAVIKLFASDARTVLDALDDAESFRRQQARECPCSDETDPGTCENCELHLHAADEYADLAGIIYDALQDYQPEASDGSPLFTTGPGSPNYGRKIDTVETKGLL
jgi:hypothetical protein